MMLFVIFPAAYVLMFRYVNGFFLHIELFRFAVQDILYLKKL